MNVFLLAMTVAFVCCVHGASIYITEKEPEVKAKKFYAFTVFTKTLRTATANNQVLDLELNHRNEDIVYNPATNVFKAPVTGVYLFYFSGVAGDATGLQLDLHSSEDGALARASTGSINSQASNMVIAKVNQGVSIDVRIALDGQKAKDCDPACSIFTGQLLYEME